MGADAPVRIPFCTGTGIIPYLVIFKIQLNLISMGLVFYQALYTSLSFPNLEIRLKEQTVSCNGQLVTLTYHEFAVLAYLARHPGWVFSAYQIYEAIWCKDGENCGTAVASVIGQIRRKLTPDTPKGGYIRTILGSGYKFSSSPF